MASHAHAHDVAKLDGWMTAVNKSTTAAIRKAGRNMLGASHTSGGDGGAGGGSGSGSGTLGASGGAGGGRQHGAAAGMSGTLVEFEALAQQQTDSLFVRAKQYTTFHNELARQTAVHCPKTAKLLVKVWQGMCDVMQEAISNYEKQMRLSKQFHAKFVRLSHHAEAREKVLARENHDLAQQMTQLRAELTARRSECNTLRREADMWKWEVNKLNTRIADEMHARLHGDKFGQHRATDTIVHLFDSDLDLMEAERTRQLAMLEDQNRLVRSTALAIMMRQGLVLDVEKAHMGTQTVEQKDSEGRAPPPPVVAQKPGIHIPKGFRKLLSIIPRKTRLVSVRHLRRLTLQILFEKAIQDRAAMHAFTPRSSMCLFVTEFMKTKYGLASLADSHISALIQSCRAFFDSDRRVRIFDLFIGSIT